MLNLKSQISNLKPLRNFRTFEFRSLRFVWNLVLGSWNFRAAKRIVAALLLILLPVTATAQFTPINQVRQLGSLQEQQDLDQVLGKIATKTSAARRQLQGIVERDIADRKLGATAAGRKVDPILAKLKADLNVILNDYAKKSPPSQNLREAFKIAQQSLDDLRALAQDGIDTAQADKQANPNQLSGKYLDYQKKAKDIVAKAITKADARLAERGTKNTVIKDLENIITDTQKQIDVASTTFLTDNPELLASAVKRINKAAMEELSQAMADRFKEANDRRNSKELDLSEADLEEVEAATAEMEAIVERAIQTADALMRQVLQAGLPTVSQEPGVNPLLQAKFKTIRQADDIVKSAVTRLAAIEKRFSERTDVSALAKEVVKKNHDREKNRLNDTLGEYRAYFSAGDPSKRKYNKEKRKAQDEAEGCGSFLCNIGRLASGAASGFISASTGGAINLNPSAISQTIGIREPNPYVTSRYASPYNSGYSALPNINGRYYVPGVYGNQNMPYDPRCYGMNSNSNPLVDKAYAQRGGNVDTEEQTTIQSGQSYGHGGKTGVVSPKKSGFAWKDALPFLGGFLVGSSGGGGRSFGRINCLGRGNIGSPFPYSGYGVDQWLGASGGGTVGFNPAFGNPQDFLRQGMGLMSQRDAGFAGTLPLFADGNFSLNDYYRILPLLQNEGFMRLRTNDPNWQHPMNQMLANICIYGMMRNDYQIKQFCLKMFTPTTGQGPGGTGTFTGQPLGNQTGSFDLQTARRYTAELENIINNAVLKDSCAEVVRAEAIIRQLRTLQRILISSESTIVGNYIRNAETRYRSACPNLSPNIPAASSNNTSNYDYGIGF